MLNKCIMVGKLGADPELKYTPQGKAVCKFDIAVDSGKKDEPTWVTIVTWEKQAETCANYLAKGRTVATVGKLIIRGYEDNQGIRRKATEIVANEVKFIGGSKDSGQSQQTAPQTDSGEIQFNEDDIPF